jgi:DNA-binding response OmpR family regulator
LLADDAFRLFRDMLGSRRFSEENCGLLVENDFLIAETVTDQSAGPGYTVIGPAYSRTDACRLAASEAIDGARLDWKLDGVASDTVADILLGRQAPFTFLTGCAEIADGRYRGVPLLEKPFLMNALGSAVTAMLRQRESGAERNR